MKNVLGLVNIQEDNSLIRELTASRAVELVPFAGRYRLVDFTLSSMVNSGIGHVGVMLPDRPRSVLDHVRSGKEWDLSRRHEGLFYLPSVKVERESREGDLKNFYANADFFEHSDKKYVLITSGSFIYNIDFNALMDFHIEKDADITMMYHVEKGENTGKNAVLEVNGDGRAEDIAEKTVVYDGSKMSLGVYLMEKRVFVEIIRNAYEHGGNDLLVDGIIKNAGKYKIYAMEHNEYVAHVESMNAYYKSSMDLLRYDVWASLFMGKNPIYTKVKDEVPVQYKEESEVKNALIANGCIVHGSVENSILFRGVKVGKGVKIKNSVIMENCDLKDGALIENVICDKNVVVSKDKWLKGAPNYPLIVTKNVTI